MDIVTLTPCRIAHVRHLGSVVPVVESVQERCAKVIRTGPRDRLHTRYASLDERGGIGPQHEARSSTRELGETGDWQVLMIERRVIQEYVGSLG